MLRHARTAIAASRAALLTIIAFGLLLAAEPARSEPGPSPDLQVTDLGAPDANGVTLTDRLASSGQTNAYTFSVAAGPSTIQVYVGDLWYDIDVSLWQLAGTSVGQPASGWLESAAGSRRRVVQFVEPKTLIRPAERGTYQVQIRPRGEAEFDPGRTFTVRVAVTPPVCAVERAPDDRYSAAIAVVPSTPTRASLLTLVAYVMPPFTDLFDFSWSVENAQVTDVQGSTAQVPAFSLPRTPSGTLSASVVIRGARQYTDPTDPTYSHVPLDGGTMTVRCDVRVADR
jgi:hypothetical protein